MLLLEIPEYTPGQHQIWRIDVNEKEVVLPGFYDPVVTVPAGQLYRLQEQAGEGWRTWMATTPFDVDSQALHVGAAEGNVVIMGLGLGVSLFNCLQNPEVEHITVVEIDKNITVLLQKFAKFRRWPGFAEKVDLVIADARKWIAPSRVHTVLVDIWREFGDNATVGNLQAIQGNTGAIQIGAWGIENIFASWVAEKGLVNQELSLENWYDFARNIRVSLVTQDPQDALRAVNNYVVGGMMREVSVNRSVDVYGPVDPETGLEEGYDPGDFDPELTTEEPGGSPPDPQPEDS